MSSAADIKVSGSAEVSPLSTPVGGETIVRNEGGNTRRVGKAGLKLLEEMASGGMSLTSMAKRLRIHRDTLSLIMKRQPEVAEAIERGYAEMEDVLVDALYQRALTTQDKGGVTAAIFLLKARRGYEGTRTPSHITINDNRQQTMVVPAAQDMETYMRRMRDGAGLTLPAERS